MTEWKTHLHFFLVIVAVSHEDTLAVLDFLFVSEVEVRRIVRELDWPCLRELTARVDFAVQDFSNGFASCLSAKISFENGIHLIDPRSSHRCSVVQNYRDVAVRCSQLFYDAVLACRHIHVLPVISFRFKTVRKTGKHYDFVCFGCRSKRFLNKCFIVNIILSGKAFDICDIAKLFCKAQRVRHFEAVDVRTASTLIAWCFREFSDEQNLFILAQRQDPVIFEQHHGFFCNLFCEFMVSFEVEYMFFSVFSPCENQIQNAFYSSVQNCFIQIAALDRLSDLNIRYSA